METVLEKIYREDFLLFSLEESREIESLNILQDYIEDKIHLLPSEDFVIAGGSLAQIAALKTLSETSDIDIFCIKPNSYSSDEEFKDKHLSFSTKELNSSIIIYRKNTKNNYLLSNDVVEKKYSYNFSLDEIKTKNNAIRNISFIKPSCLKDKYKQDNNIHSFTGTIAELLLGFDLINSMICIDKNRNIICHKHILSDNSKEIKFSTYFRNIHDIFSSTDEVNCDSPYNFKQISGYSNSANVRLKKYHEKGYWFDFSQALVHLTSSESISKTLLNEIFYFCSGGWSEDERLIYFSLYVNKYGQFRSLPVKNYYETNHYFINRIENI